MILGADGPDDIVLEEGMAKRHDMPEAALPFGLRRDHQREQRRPAVGPRRRHAQLPLRVPAAVPGADHERKFGNLTLTYATQIHACVVEVDRETGVYEIVDYAAVDDCGTRIHPQIVEGQVHGATAHALGAATFETFPYDEDGMLLTSNFYDYHVLHALDMPPLKTGFIESPSPFNSSGRRAWERAAARASTRSAQRSRTRCARSGTRIVTESHNPYHRVWSIRDSAASRAGIEVSGT